MKAFLATVLTVIAAGVLLIAYGLLAPSASAAPQVMFGPQTGMYQPARPMFAGERIGLPDVRPTRTSRTAAAPRQTAATRVVEDRAPGRDWKKTALVIGGSTATGAGVGAIFGGKKGALIGAAIGGGASTLYEAKK